MASVICGYCSYINFPWDPFSGDADPWKPYFPDSPGNWLLVTFGHKRHWLESGSRRWRVARVFPALSLCHPQRLQLNLSLLHGSSPTQEASTIQAVVTQLRLLSLDKTASFFRLSSPKGSRRPQPSPISGCLRRPCLPFGNTFIPCNTRSHIEFLPLSSQLWLFFLTGVWLIQNILKGNVKVGLEFQPAVVWPVPFQFVSCRSKEHSENHRCCSVQTFRVCSF